MKKWIFSALTCLLVAQIQWVMAAPKAELWAKWQHHQANNSQQINHQAWGGFISRYIKPSNDEINLLTYQQVTKADRNVLKNYIEELQTISITKYARQEQFAYWVNLYNAKTVQLVLEHYPVESIKDISFGWFSFGPWDEKMMTVEGESLSLNDIEHRILRPIWKDNRIHYAVNCASLGCPNLADVPFTAANAEMLLDKSARDYVNHPRGVTIKDGTILLSKIYDWYGVDFGDSPETLIQHLKRYASDELRAQLEAMKDPSFDFQYDWRLNQFP